tara:strand:- start:33107 stop:34060 length:954 start_codon:yes stop_codon:yes gene_type:complete
MTDNSLIQRDEKNRLPIIAVTMSTGLQGRGLVEELSKSNKFQVRAITRDVKSEQALKLAKLPNVSLFKGDLLDHESLTKSFEGAYGIFGNTTPTKDWRPLVREYEISQGRVLIDAVKDIQKKGDLKHFIFSSICKAKDPLHNQPAPSHFTSKWDIEEYLINKGLKEITTIIRPCSYFENFDGDLPGLKITKTSFPGVVSENKKWQTIAVKDIGYWSSAIFKNPQRFIGKSLNLAGEELTGLEMASLLEELRGEKAKKVKYIMAPRAFLKIFIHDIGIMADWIERTGYGADLNRLKKIAKEENIKMTSLSSWLQEKYL